MQKIYSFKEFEDKIDTLWYKSGVTSPEYKNNYFKKKIDKDPFVVVIPPPNVTGVLHMGHALNNSVQDTLVRYKRMNGHPTVWIPGCDHAGIATQQVMERNLKKENITRAELGRGNFIKQTHKLSENHKTEIMKQLRKMGASCDWSRERFTLDDGLSKSVNEVFVTLYERGLIYRGDYLVNWSVGAGTALSDDEVEYKELQGFLYHISYLFADEDTSYTDSDGNVMRSITIATTRPETLLGDTAVAVHPDDKRYKILVGKRLKLPLTDRTIPIIADTHVKPEFGSGAVKITPAHDPNDYEIGNRHSLERINILNTDGTLNVHVPKQYRGLSVQQARKKVCEDLETQKLLVKVEAHKHQVGHCYRTGTVVEPMLSTQWFVKMRGMAEKALQAWKNGDITFYPKHWENTFVHWLNNIKDWCISRQLWWGHRIPVWYDDSSGEIIVSRDNLDDNPTLRREKDVLDTWFSSWIWPFSVFGWPNNTDDLQKYYPTTTLVTAYDIIFFWVARMVMAGLEFRGQVPFKDIYIHGLVRDDKGRKMSKSLGNGIDPLVIIDEYGADALKFTLLFLCKSGADVIITTNKFQLGSRFCNKVWNASRFVLISLKDIKLDTQLLESKILPEQSLSLIDKWILLRLNNTIKMIDKMIAAYRLDEASKLVYEYFWSDFCDWYVEVCKNVLNSKNATSYTDETTRCASVLLWVLRQNLKLLHPFMPFITEEIYRYTSDLLGEQYVLLAGMEYPQHIDNLQYTGNVLTFSVFQELVTGIRTLRSEFNLAPKLKITFSIYTEDDSLYVYFNDHKNIIANLTGSTRDDVKIFLNETKLIEEGICIEGRGFVASVYVKHVINIDKEKGRLLLRKEKDEKQLCNIQAQLKNEKFLTKAATEYIKEIKIQEKEIEKKIQKITKFYEQLAT